MISSKKCKYISYFESGYNHVAMDLVKTRLAEVCDKPNGIKIVSSEIDFKEDTSWSANDVRDARWKHGGCYEV